MADAPPPDWMTAALADLEAYKAKLEMAIVTIRELQARNVRKQANRVAAERTATVVNTGGV